MNETIINLQITVIIQDPTGKELWSFIAENEKHFCELAALHGIELPYSCGGGVCGICLCEVESGEDAIQEDLITTPIMPLAKDENGYPKEILACIAGVKSELFQKNQPHTIILKRKY